MRAITAKPEATDRVKMDWRLRAFPHNFLSGNHRWGWVRLFAVFFIILVFSIIGTFLFANDSTMASVILWQKGIPLLKVVPAPMLQIIAGWPFGIPAFAALTGAFLLTAHYLQDMYELRKFSTAVRYLLASLFYLAPYPRLTVAEGKKRLKENQEYTLDIIGGPGYVVIQPGNVVLFEQLRNPSNVRDAGFHFIPRFETIKEIINLEDQDGQIDEVQAVSKDGVVILVKDIRFRYRLWAGGQAKRTPEKPYPFSVQAVRNMAYNRAASKEGLIPWHKAVQGAVQGAIIEYISKHQLDEITAPRSLEGDPREEIRRQLHSTKTRSRLKEVGAQLLWCDIGYFDAKEETVDKQRLKTWQAHWIGHAAVTRARGEAKRLEDQELGQAEAQAELLTSIMRALKEIELPEGSQDEHVHNIILLRTAQVLESLSSLYNISPLENPSPDETDAKGEV